MILRRSVVGCVQHSPVALHIAANLFKRLDQLEQELSVSSDRQTFDILEDKVGSVEFPRDTHEVLHKSIARVVKRPLADQRESLARRATEYRIDRFVSDT